jgi:hypothetical protein
MNFLSRRFFSRANYPLEKPVRFQDMEVVAEDIKNIIAAIDDMGATWFFGSGVPGFDVGVDNNFYYDTSSKNYYLKIGGEWTLEGNMGGVGIGDDTVAWLGL